MDEIIDFVKVLVDKEFVYEVNGDVYFRVSKLYYYVKLVNKILEDLEIGVSGCVDGEGEIKENFLDFVFWKLVKFGEVLWESFWGKGCLGWYIECFVMVIEIFGDIIDIYGGGVDLEFLYYMNEIV